MPISELVIGNLQPAVARAGLLHIRKAQPTILNSVPGSLSNFVGQVLKHNGEDVSSQYKPILALEWSDMQSFHAFYPTSAAFKSFGGVFAPYAAEKAKPLLFTPDAGAKDFSGLLNEVTSQIFVASSAAEKKDDASGAWNELLRAVEKSEGLSGQWSGWGVEGDEGTWAGILSWKGVEDFEKSLADAGVTEALQKFKADVQVEDYLVEFTSISGAEA